MAVGKDETKKADAGSRTPALNGSRLMSLPVIDFAGIFSDELAGNCSREDARARIRDDLRRAGSEWGAFLVVNHGVPGEVVEQLCENGRQFMAQPQEAKEGLLLHTSLLVDGYCRNAHFKCDDPVADKKKDLYIETLRYQLSPAESVAPPQFWPENPPTLRSNLMEMGLKAAKLTEVLLELVSEDLGLPSSAIRKSIGDEYTMNSRLLFYHPVCTESSDAPVSLPAHTDFDILTCIVQAPDALHPALQILKNDTQEWFTVDPAVPSNSLLFFVGDQLEALTNGVYKSPGHRVLANSEKSRISTVFFYFADYDLAIGPLPELIDDRHPKLYRAFTYKDRVHRYLTPGAPGVDKAWLLADPPALLDN